MTAWLPGLWGFWRFTADCAGMLPVVVVIVVVVVVPGRAPVVLPGFEASLVAWRERIALLNASAGLDWVLSAPKRLRLGGAEV